MKGTPQEAIETLLWMATLKGHTPGKYSNPVNKIEVFPQLWRCEVCCDNIVRETTSGNYDVGLGLIAQCGSSICDSSFQDIIEYLQDNFRGNFF